MVAAAVIFAVGAIFLGTVGLGILGHIARIADAVEAQNRFYSIGTENLDQGEQL